MKQVIGLTLVLAGAAMVAVGVFLPLVSAPYVGAVTFITSGDSPRIVMFAMGIAALALALVGQVRHALWPGLLALGALGFGWFQVQDKLAQFEARFGDNLIGRLARRATDSIQYEGGWAVLLLGAVLIVVGAIIAWFQPQVKASPTANRVAIVIGAAMVAVGIFLPLVQVPRIGVETDILGGPLPRIGLVVAAVAALAIALLGWTRHALWPGLLGCVALGFAYGQVLANIRDVQARIEGLEERLGGGLLGRVAGKATDLLEKRYGEDVLAKAADKATELIQLQWGWAVLTVGLVLIVIAGIRGWFEPRPAVAYPFAPPSGDVSQIPGAQPRQ